MVTVRDAAVADIPRIRAVLVETWHATYDATMGAAKVTEVTDRWHAIDVLSRQVGEAEAAFLVAEADGEIVATASAGLSQEGQLVLRRLYVIPSAQRAGVGANLLNACLERFPSARSVRLEVDPANDRAIAFYQKHGFVGGETGRACGGDQQAALPHLVMLRSLGGA